MGIELILLVVIGLVFLIDFIVKKRKKNFSNEIEKSEESINDSIKKPSSLKRIVISLAFLALSFFVVYQFVFTHKIYKYSEVTFNNKLAYSKSDMSLLTGKINDSIHNGLFVDGKREGYHKFQYSYFDKGTINSITSSLYKDTTLYQAEGEFVNNKYNGLWSFYHMNGQLASKGSFNESKGDTLDHYYIPSEDRKGLWRYWYENGQLKREVNYVNGKMVGLYLNWEENGQLSAENFYINGKKEGLSQSWWSNGQLMISDNFVNGKKEGLSQLWLDNGQLWIETNFVNDKIEGLSQSWWKNGQLHKQRNYVNGKIQGLSREWYENGQLNVESNYLNGKKEGLFTLWEDSGQIIIKGNYVNDDKEGLWRNWDKKGNRLRDDILKEGRLIN